jgi:hypothetical protein
MSDPLTVRALLDVGADRLAINDNGSTVLMVACENPRMDVATLELIWQNGDGIDINAQSHPTSILWKSINFFSRVGVLRNPMQQNVWAHQAGCTALHRSAQAGYVPIVQWLLDHGALYSLNVCTVSGLLPLDLSRIYGPHPRVEEMLSLLMKVGQSIHVDNPYPMYVIPVEGVLALDRWMTHEELRHRGRVVRYQPTVMKKVIFISAEMTSADDPDHTGHRLGTLQGVLRQMLAGKVRDVRPPVRDQGGAGSLSSLDPFVLSTEELVELATDAVIWYAPVSLPSSADLTDEPARLRELESVATCLFENVSLMLSICTPVPHRELNRTCDFASWLRLGQSRFELAATLFQTRQRIPVLICNGPDARPTMMSRTQMACAPVGLGEHACCQADHKVVHPTLGTDFCTCSKELMGPLLLAMIEHRTAYHLRRGELTQYRVGERPHD